MQDNGGVISDSPFFESNRPHTFKCTSLKTGFDKVDERRRSDRRAIHFGEGETLKVGKPFELLFCLLWRPVEGHLSHTGAMLLGSMIMRLQGGLIDHIRNRDQKGSAIRT